ncbi:MAG: hypothetical protein OXQ93_01845 [Gemmatimonadota bacterium]|nr:hypothetical protein [Gemmatimonadota bacterium]
MRLRGASGVARLVRVRPAALLWFFSFLALTAASSLDAQRRPDRREENRMLREASTHVARGELAEAEATLRELLKRQPLSSSALLALERVLRADERIADLLPVLDTRLADQPAANHVWALKLKVLTDIGDEDELKKTVRQWIRAVPDAPDPYRDGARALREALGPDEAAAVIREGLAALGDSPRMLVELGDALIAAGRAEEGAAAWARALRLDPERDTDIRDRLEKLGDGAPPVSAAIVAALMADPVTLPGLEVGAALALSAADTAAALEARARITGLYPPGTSDRTTAWAEELRIRVAAGDPAEAATALAGFRDAHPESADLDELASTLAPRLLAGGMRETALSVLEGIEGPGAALERAFLLLEGGAYPDGIAAVQAALPELAPSFQTEMLDLALVLSEVTTVGASLAARAAIARHRGRPGEAVTIVREGIDRVPAPDRPAILALGARVADQAELATEAAAFRRRIVAEHQGAREYPEAALLLARAVAEEPGGREEAAGILEALIVAHPDSPVVPGARRELDRIRGGGGR